MAKIYIGKVATTKKYLYTLTLLIAILLPQNSAAQLFETRTKVDTLTLAERLSLHTNAVDWTLLVPNVGIEYDIRSTNWNRWAVGLTLRNRWKTPATFKQDNFYNLTEARLYFRNYWRSRKIDNKSLFRHTNFLDRLFSCRRSRVKHPGTTYYRGLYVSAADYSVKFGHEGHQGKAFSAGFTYGCVYPLYTFSSGNTLDLDLGVDVGVVYTQTEKFVLDDESNCYKRTSNREGKLVPFPLPTEARVGFVYRFGKYPITKKYRWRYDVDIDYMQRIDNMRYQRDSIRQADHFNDSIRTILYQEFWSEYDSVAKVNGKAAQLQQQEAAKVAKAKAEQAKADAKAAKAEVKKDKGKAKSKKADDKQPLAADSTGIATPAEANDSTGAITPTEPADTTEIIVPATPTEVEDSTEETPGPAETPQTDTPESHDTDNDPQTTQPAESPEEKSDAPAAEARKEGDHE